MRVWILDHPLATATSLLRQRLGEQAGVGMDLMEACDLVILPDGCRETAVRDLPLEALAQHRAQGGAILGLGTGFAALGHAGLLPVRWEATAWRHGRMPMRVERTNLPFTRAWGPGELIEVPVATALGHPVLDDEARLDLELSGCVVFRTPDKGFGGPTGIAGVASEDGRVMGWIGLPERDPDLWQTFWCHVSHPSG